MSYKITDEQKKALLQYSAQTLPDNPSREGFSAESIRKRMYKPIEKLIDLVNSVFDTAYTDVKSIITAIKSGDLFARSVASWSASYTYGADEITFYPSIGTYGAFVQSVVAGNTNNTPYVDGAINSAYWKEVVNFNNIAEDYFQQVQEAVAQAESAAREADNSAQVADGSARAAAGSAAQAARNEETTNTLVERALDYAEQSEGSANIASQSATLALRSEEEAQQSAAEAAQSATESQASAEQSRIYSERALQYNYEYSSVAELPVPGSTRYIYMIPKTSPDADDYYDEYAWSESNNDYSLIGTSKTSVDLSNYYTKSQVDGKISSEAKSREQADATLQQGINAKYTKPSSGIPESDLAQAVKDKLNKESISQSDIISVETLPTATADSPDFVQTPDGKLYRKQTIQNDSLIGTWQLGYGINATIPQNWTFDFTCDGVNYTGILVQSDLESIKYQGTNPVTVYQFGWLDDKYKTINITDTSGITDISAFTQWMNQAGTKLPTYSYEEVGAGAAVEYMTDAEVNALFN